MVKRFSIGSQVRHFYEDEYETHFMEEDRQGDYVKYEDYLAMVAQAEVLRGSLQRLYLEFQKLNLVGEHNLLISELDFAKRALTKMEPAACLAQVRAEAGRAGFIAGAEWWAKCELEDSLHLDEQLAADQYAESIRQEVK